MFSSKIVLPRPNHIPVVLRDSLRVLLISEQINSLTRRVQNALKGKVNSSVLETCDPRQMISRVREFQPDIIVCPFMKTKLPEELYKHRERPCLIVHPGIAGDRGACSLDWALFNKEKSWGVTVLEASPIFDNGNIWCTENFQVPENSTKSSLYNGAVSDAAVRCVVDSLSRFCQSIPPSCLDDMRISGAFVRNMKHSDRRIDWTRDSDHISAQVHMSDTRPGAIWQFDLPGVKGECRIFDACVETGEKSKEVAGLLKGAMPGNIVARKNKSILIKSGDKYGVWVGQMKKMTKEPSLKLPSIDFLTNVLKTDLKVPTIQEACNHDDIYVVRNGQVAFVYFNFYNGAMDRQQGVRLKHTLTRVNEMDDVKVIVLMGGDRFFSTGINLCVIEGSSNKQVEAWANINAIDDVIETFVNMTNKTTVAVLRGNAGAGGAMMAAACDIALSHEGALISPSYKSMNLYGSEYWSYFLPRRVGHSTAKSLVETTGPISAIEAKSIGLIDDVIFTDKSDLIGATIVYIDQLIKDGVADRIIRRKRVERDAFWRQLLQSHRSYELSQMKENFRSPEFLTAMNNFVFH